MRAEREGGGGAGSLEPVGSPGGEYQAAVVAAFLGCPSPTPGGFCRTKQKQVKEMRQV